MHVYRSSEGSENAFRDPKIKTQSGEWH